MSNSRNAMLALALIAATAGLGQPSESCSHKPKPPEPRRFTDARKEEAEAKRQRKAAKRAMRKQNTKS